LNITKLTWWEQPEKIFRYSIPQTDLQYRFGLPGPQVNENEWQAGLDIVERSLSENDFLVVSGKLTSGIPDDYYMMVGEIAKRKKRNLF